MPCPSQCLLYSFLSAAPRHARQPSQRPWIELLHNIWRRESVLYISYRKYSAADSDSAGILKMVSKMKIYLGPVHVLMIHFQQHYNLISAARVNRFHIFVPFGASGVEPGALGCAAMYIITCSGVIYEYWVWCVLPEVMWFLFLSRATSSSLKIGH